MVRRLAAILAADMVGFSRLMAADEAGTLARQKAHRDGLIDPTIEEYGGRLVKSTGDGVLVEFPSVVDALCCAVTIQLAMPDFEKNRPPDNPIAYRIGVNLGDIIIEDDADIYGNGVNIAARLEALADPGGICVSQTVVDHIGNKVASAFEDIGEQRVKNIPEQIHCYRVLMQPEAAGASGEQPEPAPRSRRPFVAVVAVFALVVAGLAMWQPWTPKVAPASEERMAFALPDKPSLAVLPFDNMSGDAEQDYFADGLTEDLITDLSKISGLFVIARNSTFTYKGTPVEVRQVAEDLGVRYVLEGSVRRAGNEVRINAQLIDATTGGHVWADRYDGSATDIFSVQDEFVRKIVKALAVNLTEAEQEELGLGQTANIEAREAFQKGWESYQLYNAVDNAEAVGHFEAALKLDPDYGRAFAAVSLAYLRGCQLRWHEPLGISIAEANTRAQVNLSETNERPSALAHVAGSRVNLYNNRYDKAVTEATLAIAKDPNDPEGYVAMAWAMITTGKAAAGLELLGRAIRLNPTYPQYYSLALGMAYFAMDDLEKAVGVFSETLEGNPDATELAPPLASSLALLGKIAEARAALLIWKPGASEKELEFIDFEYHFPYEWSQDRTIHNRLYDGLRFAALSPDNIVPELADTLTDGNPFMQLQAVGDLQLFGEDAVLAVPALINALNDKRTTMRAKAARTLGSIGPGAHAAVPALQAMMGEAGVVGEAAIESLKKITGK